MKEYVYTAWTTYFIVQNYCNEKTILLLFFSLLEKYLARGKQLNFLVVQWLG